MKHYPQMNVIPIGLTLILCWVAEAWNFFLTFRLYMFLWWAIACTRIFKMKQNLDSKITCSNLSPCTFFLCSFYCEAIFVWKLLLITPPPSPFPLQKKNSNDWSLAAIEIWCLFGIFFFKWWVPLIRPISLRSLEVERLLHDFTYIYTSEILMRASSWTVTIITAE